MPLNVARTEPGNDRPLLACLVPVRNGAEHLDEWLACVGRFADVVVALDDGSTDDTLARLEASPLVQVVLRNPVRPTYRGWDDAGNRRRLLEATAAIDPRWVLFLDVDERIPPDDAAALRRFVGSDADPEDAYLFRVYRMCGDLEHCDQTHVWVGRLFAYHPGLRLPADRLHFVPVPTTIPASRRRRTTIRIQHLAGLDDDTRRARLRKYEQADPDRDFQRGYAHLLEPPDRIRPWWPRSAHLAVIGNRVAPRPTGTTDATAAPDRTSRAAVTAPALSVIVIAQDDEADIEAVVRAILAQEVAEPFETIVVTSGRDRTAEIVRRFPAVQLVELDHPVLPGAARNAGLQRATGEYVAFPGSHIEIRPGSLAAKLGAHREGYAMVMGSMLNGTPTAAGWATYFVDNSGVLPTRPSHVLSGPPARCSYLREALVDLGGFPEDMRAGEDTVVNVELFERGYSAWRARDAVFVHRSPCRTTRRLVRHHFVRGRAMGRILFEDAVSRGPVLNRRVVRYLLLVSTAARIVRTTRNVAVWGDGLRLRYARAFPLVVLALGSSWVGGCYELARRAARRRRRAAANQPASHAESRHQERRGIETS